MPLQIPMYREPDEPVWRTGKFSISEEIVRLHWPLLSIALSEVFIIRCEHNYARREFDYTGLSMSFAAVENYSEPPEYRPIIHNENGNIYVEWQRLD